MIDPNILFSSHFCIIGNSLLYDEIPQIPIYARAQDLKHHLDLKKAGATDAIMENAEVLTKFLSSPYGWSF